MPRWPDIPVAPIRWQSCWKITPDFQPWRLELRLREIIPQNDDNDFIQLNEPLRMGMNDRDIINHPFDFPAASRFSDGAYGVFYAADEFDTAVKEKKYHHTQFMQTMEEPPGNFNLRAYMIDLDGNLHDLRGQGQGWNDSRGYKVLRSKIYHANNYAASQRLAKGLHQDDSQGIVYNSVRRSGYECVAVFNRKLLENPRLGRYLDCEWDGRQIGHIEITELSENGKAE